VQYCTRRLEPGICLCSGTLYGTNLRVTLLRTRERSAQQRWTDVYAEGAGSVRFGLKCDSNGANCAQYIPVGNTPVGIGVNELAASVTVTFTEEGDWTMFYSPSGSTQLSENTWDRLAQSAPSTVITVSSMCYI
jgi:hypothetical protein